MAFIGAQENDVASLALYLKKVKETSVALPEVQLNENFAPVLAHIMSYRGQSFGEEIQIVAGALLQIQASQGLPSLPSTVVAFIKIAALNGTCAPSAKIKATAAAVLQAIACNGPFEDWPELFPTILRMVDSQSRHEAEGAFVGLDTICDVLRLQLKAHASRSPLEALVSKLVSCLEAPGMKRGRSLECIKKLAQRPAILPRSDVVLNALIATKDDPSSEIRRLSIQLVLMLIDSELVDTAENLSPVIDWMIGAVEDVDELVAMHACTFWVKIFTDARNANGSIFPAHIHELLPRLVAVLLSRLKVPEEYAVYSESDVHDISIVDSVDENIDARHQRSQLSSSDAAASKLNFSCDLRRIAASALDTIASMNDSLSVLPVVLPLLQERLMHSDVLVRETGILAIGAIAECQVEMGEHLKHIFPYLVKQLVDPSAQIRRISCWSLSRYAAWVFKAENGVSEVQLQELVQGLMMRVLDRHKLVQEAACSALTSIQGHASARIVPYVSYFLRNLMHAFSLYQANNLMVLCDTIGTLADTVGPALSSPECANALLPPMWAKWQRLSSVGSPLSGAVPIQLAPLLECITSLVQALGSAAQPYLAAFFGASLEILQKSSLAESPNSADAYLNVCALDLLAVLCANNGEEFWHLALNFSSSGNSSIFHLVEKCSSCAQIRQSACVLFGAISKECGQHLKDGTNLLFPLLLQNLEMALPAVCNNASWALGELVMHLDPVQVQPFVESIMQRLISLINDKSEKQHSLSENACITIGRLGCSCPGLTAPLLGQFCKEWCLRMPRVQSSFERENTSRALCLMAIANPKALSEHFPSFCNVASLWSVSQSELPPDVYQMFHGILHSYFNNSKQRKQLSQYMASTSTENSAYLRTTYKLIPVK